MEKFYFSRFTFSIRCKTTLLLPSYNGSTLRGGFGHAFRRIICAFKGKECKDCLLRRISLLSYLHCNHRIDDTGFKDLIQRARDIKTVKRSLYWHDWERYSNRQKTRMKIGGFMGEIAYEGELGLYQAV